MFSRIAKFYQTKKPADYLFHKDVFIPDKVAEQVYGKTVRLQPTMHAIQNIDRALANFGVYVDPDIYFNRTVTVGDNNQVIEVGMNYNQAEDKLELTHLLLREPFNDEFDLVYAVDIPSGNVKTFWLNRKGDIHRTLERGRYVLPVQWQRYLQFKAALQTLQMSKDEALKIIEDFDRNYAPDFVVQVYKKPDGDYEFIIDWNSLPYEVQKAFETYYEDRVVGYEVSKEDVAKELARVLGLHKWSEEVFEVLEYINEHGYINISDWVSLVGLEEVKDVFDIGEYY